MTVFKVATFNTNSIHARIPVITDWLERERPDILCLQETKVQDKDFPAGVSEEQGYNVAYRGQKSYNGVAMVAQHPMVDIRHSLYGEEGEEARFISARVRDIPVVGVYVPQGFAPGTEKFAYKLQWLRDLLALLRGEYRPEAPLLVMDKLSMPGILLEVAYLSNPEDRVLLSDDESIDRLSQALCDSILNYISEHGKEN